MLTHVPTEIFDDKMLQTIITKEMLFTCLPTFY